MITDASFPTPDLALRSANKDEDRRVRHFAVEQAAAAEEIRPCLDDQLHRAANHADRVAALTSAHAGLVGWRYELALRTERRLGRGLAHDASRFSKPLNEAGPNYDRIGYIGRFRDGAEWDPSTRTFRGGRDTPAHRIMLAYGRVAADRFAREEHDGDVLRNLVVLPDGSRLTGNSLVRGAAAERIADDLVDRIARRGGDTTRIETGGAPMYVVSATDSARDRMFRAAMSALADAAPGDVRAWQAARYLLYQAPVTKKGSDAVARTFLVVVGAILFESAPVLEQDVDLRCMVSGQRSATVLSSDPVTASAATPLR
jgi:hypothetical protein